MRFKGFWTMQGGRFFAEEGGGTEPGGGGGTETHWLDASPDYSHLAKDTDARAALKDYKTTADALKAIPELKRAMRTTFRMPDNLEGLKPEESGKVLDRLKGILKPDHMRRLTGAPDKPEAYELTRPTLPEGFAYPEEREKALRGLAVKHGLSGTALQELHELVLSGDVAAYEKQINDTLSAAKKAVAICEGKYGDKWPQIQEVSKQMLTEYAKKAGTDYEKVIGDVLTQAKPETMAALMATLGEMAVKLHAEGITKPGKTGSGGGEIDIDARWPASKEIMRR